MPRGVYQRKNASRKWTPERRARQAATIQAKKVKMSGSTVSTIFTAFAENVDTELARLTAEIERLQKVRDLLR